MASAREYYLGQNYNCAESTIHTANDEYGLGLTEEAMKLLAGFGGGLSCGNACGALCSSVAVLSVLLVEQRARETEGFKEICAAFVERFHKHFGCTDCETLKAKNNVETGERCIKTVEECEALLRAFIEEIQI